MSLYNENIDSSKTLNYNDLENTWGHGAAGSAPRSQSDIEYFFKSNEEL